MFFIIYNYDAKMKHIFLHKKVQMGQQMVKKGKIELLI